MSDNTQLLTVQTLLEELKEIDDWYLLGAYLGVPVYKLNEIQSEQRRVERCKLNMLQHWLNTTMTASWRDIARAVEQMNRLTLAAKLKRKYLWQSPTTLEESVRASAQPAAAGHSDTGDTAEPPPSPTATSTADVEADVKVVRELQDLESSFSKMLLDMKDDLANCDISRIQFFLNDLFDTDEFSSCDTIDKVLRQLRQGHVDTFNVYYLQQLISQCQQSDTAIKSVLKYDIKKEKFLEATTVKEFQQAIVSKAETLPPKGMAEMTIRIPSKCKVRNLRTLKDVEELAKRSFPDCENSFINIKVKPGSIIITWYVPESLCEKLERLAHENAAVLREEGVEEVTIVDRKKKMFFSTKEWLKLKNKLKSTEEKLEIANKSLIKKKTEQKKMESALGCLVQVNEEGKDITTAVGQMTSIELSISSLPFPLDQLSCKLTDPNSQHVECNITPTQPNMATVSYTPTLRGAHQLKITVGDTDIPGSPFTVSVLPPKMTGVPSPWGVAVSSKSGNVVVSEHGGHRISIFSREGKEINKFGSKGSCKEQFDGPCGVTITTNNRILVVDRNNHRIQMLTIEGEFVRSVGEKGNGPLQFNYPSGIAVHPSDRQVFIVDNHNHRIQVLHSDLSFSHMFGSHGSGPGQFDLPNDVACDSSGIVYVTDCYNNRVQLFSVDGQFISSNSFGRMRFQSGQLYCPRGIYIDSTDTVYVTDENHCVSAFRSHGKFLKCFGERRSRDDKLYFPEGIAVDNAGNIYVCDFGNDRVVVY